MTDVNRSHPSWQAKGERTPYVWHFRKLMDQLEQIHRAICETEAAVEQSNQQ